MRQLVLKDIRLIGLMNIILVLVALVLGYVGSSYNGVLESNAIYIASTLIGTYFIVTFITNKDVLSNTQPLLISMPTRRFTIVISRYLTIFSYIIFIMAILFLSSNISRIIFEDIKGSIFLFHPMALTLSLLLIFISISLPIQYYDIKKAQIFNALIYMFLILFPNVYDKLGFNFINPSLIDSINNLNFKVITPLIFLMALSFYFLSMFISKIIYEKKEF